MRKKENNQKNYLNSFEKHKKNQQAETNFTVTRNPNWSVEEDLKKKYGNVLWIQRVAAIIWNSLNHSGSDKPSSWYHVK